MREYNIEFTNTEHIQTKSLLHHTNQESATPHKPRVCHTTQTKSLPHHTNQESATQESATPHKPRVCHTRVCHTTQTKSLPHKSLPHHTNQESATQESATPHKPRVCHTTQAKSLPNHTSQESATQESVGLVASQSCCSKVLLPLVPRISSYRLEELIFPDQTPASNDRLMA